MTKTQTFRFNNKTRFRTVSRLSQTIIEATEERFAMRSGPLRVLVEQGKATGEEGERLLAQITPQLQKENKELRSGSTAKLSRRRNP